MDKKEYFQEYYKKNKDKIAKRNKKYYYNNKTISGRETVFYPGELAKLKSGKTGVVIKDYGKYIRLNIPVGETYYSECCFKGDLEKYE